MDRARPATGTSGSGTRQRILSAALELFATQGYAGTSIRDISERMGFTKAALYYHFGSKEEILDAVTGPLSEEFQQLAQRAARRPPLRAEELISGLVDILSRRAGLIRTVMGDPSFQHRRHDPKVLDMVNGLATALAADESTTAQLRARAALGAAQFATFSTAMRRAAAGPALGGEGGEGESEQIIERGRHLLTGDERAEIVAAALRALRGSPTPPAQPAGWSKSPAPAERRAKR